MAGEREVLQRRLDDPLRRRIRHDVVLDEIQSALNDLHRFRAAHGIITDAKLELVAGNDTVIRTRQATHSVA